MAGRLNKRVEIYDLSIDEENVRQSNEVSEFEEKCDEEVATINSHGVSNIITVKKEIPLVVEISDDEEFKTDEEEVKITMEVIVKRGKEKKEEDGEIQILKELIRPKKDKEEGGDEVQDVTPETICLDGVPKEDPHRPIGYRTAMKRLKTNNSRLNKLRQKPGYIQYLTKWYPEGYAREYCEWYERHFNPFLQAKLAPHLKYYQHLTSNPPEMNQACSSQSPEEQIPITADLNIQEENVETIAVDTAEKNNQDEVMVSEGNPPMSIAVSYGNQGEFQNANGEENKEEFQNPGDNESQEEDLEEFTILKMIQDTPTTDFIQLVSDLLADNEQKMENESE